MPETPGGIVVDVDDTVDVLYVRRADAEPVASVEGTDQYLVLDVDDIGSVVGLSLMSAHEMPADYWFGGHPDRTALPVDLRTALDDWIRAKR